MVGDGPELDRAVAASRRISASKARCTSSASRIRCRQLLSIADVFLLPSAQESFGLAALEAMACEVPVVASSVGGLPEVIDHGRTGFLHPPDDLDGMAAAAVALLTDNDLRRRVAAAALLDVQTKFCGEHIVPLYEQYYQEILTSPERLAR